MNPVSQAFGDETLAPRTHQDRAAWIISEIRSLGLKINPVSRLMRMHDVIQQGGTISPNDGEAYEIALEAVRDLSMVEFILEQLKDRNDARFKELVYKLLKDAVLPEKDGKVTRGRDTQFELYLMAIGQHAGILVGHQEPDIVFNLRETTYGMAAKRLKSLDRFEERVRDGSNQIKRHGHPGIVAVDVTMGFNPENRPITSPLESDSYENRIRKRLTRFLEGHEDAIHWSVAGKGVLGILVLNWTLRVRKQEDRQPGLDGMTAWFPTTRGSRRRERELRRFREAFCRGMKNLDQFN